MTFGVRHRRPAGARRWWALVARTLGYDVGVVRPPADSRVMYEHLGFNALPPSAAGYVIGTASADVN